MRDAPKSLLSNGENHSCLSVTVLKIFKKWLSPSYSGQTVAFKNISHNASKSKGYVTMNYIW